MGACTGRLPPLPPQVPSTPPPPAGILPTAQESAGVPLEALPVVALDLKLRVGLPGLSLR